MNPAVGTAFIASAVPHRCGPMPCTPDPMAGESACWHQPDRRQVPPPESMGTADAMAGSSACWPQLDRPRVPPPESMGDGGRDECGPYRRLFSQYGAKKRRAPVTRSKEEWEPLMRRTATAQHKEGSMSDNASDQPGLTVG